MVTGNSYCACMHALHAAGWGCFVLFQCRSWIQIQTFFICTDCTDGDIQLMDGTSELRDVWKSVSMEHRALCVMTFGVAKMLMWLADSWDSLVHLKSLSKSILCMRISRRCMFSRSFPKESAKCAEISPTSGREFEFSNRSTCLIIFGGSVWSYLAHKWSYAKIAVLYTVRARF